MQKRTNTDSISHSHCESTSINTGKSPESLKDNCGDDFEEIDEVQTPSSIGTSMNSQHSTFKSKSKGGLFSSLFRKEQPSLDESYSHSLYESLTSLSSKIVGTGGGIGTLNKETFLTSGDYLVSIDNAWEWSFNVDNMLTDFPPDRQYLINKGLPCLNINTEQEKVHLDVEENELWTLPQFTEDIEINHFYDLSITYDNANATPRIWLFGYDKIGHPLSAEEIIKDMAVQAVGSVATMIPHPISNVLNVSIHPCKHAQVMSHLIAYQKERSTAFDPEKEYLILFLRLINQIFPNLILGDVASSPKTPSR